MKYLSYRPVAVLSVGLAASVLLLSGCSSSEPVVPDNPDRATTATNTPAPPTAPPSASPGTTSGDALAEWGPPSSITRENAEAVNLFGSRRIDNLADEMDAFVRYALTDPGLVTGDTTYAAALERLRLQEAAAAKAAEVPTSLLMARGLNLPEGYEPADPYIEHLGTSRPVYVPFGTRKRWYLRTTVTGYARTHFKHDGQTYYDLIKRTYVLYLTPNTADRSDLNKGETYKFWRVAAYEPSLVEYADAGPFLTPEGVEQ